MPTLIRFFSKTVTLFLLFICGFTGSVSAQTDDIMFVEYVDWTNGSGWAVKIFNPTGSSIDLSDYYLRIYRNGGTACTENEQLTGTLGSKQTVIVGNDAYCNNECTGSCGIAINTLGINGNEILELATVTCTIDLIGAKGVDLGSQDGWTVDGTTKATYRNTLTRNSNNGIRYTRSDGVAPHSWPTDRSNFLGWSVGSVHCLTNGYTLNVTVPNTATGVVLNFEDSIVCVGNSIRVSATPNADWEIVETGRTVTNASNLTFSEGAGTYTIIAKSLNCGGDDTCTIEVRDAGSINILGESTVCEGGSISFSTDIAGGNRWQNAIEGDTYVLDNITKDTSVIVENKTAGCGVAYDTMLITVVKKPTLPTERNYTVPVTMDSTIKIDRTSTYTFSRWTVNGMEWSSDEVDYTHPETLVVCSVVGESEECVDSTCVTYEPKLLVPPFVLFVPNVITPNDDKLNDVFHVYLEGGEVEEIAIYNRWGERLYEGAKDTAMWDGTFKNKKVPNGTYFFVGRVLNFSNQEVQNISGIVEVVR